MEKPDFPCLEKTLVERQGKMYLDFLQNWPQAALYSVRPKPGETASIPLDLSEVKLGFR